MTIELTPHQMDETRKLQKIVKLYESVISVLLIAIALSFFVYLTSGILNWFIDGVWSPEGLKLCSLVLARGCQPFFSEIYAINLSLNWIFDLNIFLFSALICFALFIFFNRGLNSRLDRIDVIRELAKAKLKQNAACAN